jgi:hypothetical protein
MMNDEILTLYTLVCSTGLLLAAACIAILRFQKKALEAQAFWNSPTGAVIQLDDDNSQKIRERHLEARLAELQKMVDELSRRDRVTQLPTPISALPFENAMRMARQGASIEDLTRSCGLSLGEARLIHRMHGRNAA